MDKFTENLIKKLECNNIKQKSKLFCAFFRWVEFLVFIFIVILDSFLFSLIFFYIKEVDYNILKNLHQSVLFFLPYFWITLFIGIIIVSYLCFYFKFKGYKLNPIVSLGLVFVITSGFGFSISSINGLNEGADEVLSLKMPYYYNTVLNDNIWDDCCDGDDCGDCLFGRLKSIEIDKEKNIISLVDDRNNEIFSVFYEGDIKDVYDCNFIINNRYKIIARRSLDGSYKILEVRPWHNDECPKKR